ncbi:hypothetical protein SAMN05216428_11065 [Nitrosospira sp. Nsp11]|nr:hypothetical protein SAMN05216428_11065 [Nitrosospira sp. Nsp11]
MPSLNQRPKAATLYNDKKMNAAQAYGRLVFLRSLKAGMRCLLMAPKPESRPQCVKYFVLCFTSTRVYTARRK